MKVKITQFGIFLDGENDTIIGGLEISGYETADIRNFIIKPGYDKLTFIRPPAKFDINKIEANPLFLKIKNGCGECNGLGEVINNGVIIAPIDGIDIDLEIAFGKPFLCPICKKIMSN